MIKCYYEKEEKIEIVLVGYSSNRLAFCTKKATSCDKASSKCIAIQEKTYTSYLIKKNKSKIGTVSRDVTTKSLKAQLEESECYIKMLFLKYFILF